MISGTPLPVPSGEWATCTLHPHQHQGRMALVYLTINQFSFHLLVVVAVVAVVGRRRRRRIYVIVKRSRLTRAQANRYTGLSFLFQGKAITNISPTNGRSIKVRRCISQRDPYSFDMRFLCNLFSIFNDLFVPNTDQEADSGRGSRTRTALNANVQPLVPAWR